MRVLCGRRSAQRGGARLNLLIVLAVICAAAYAGYQVVPVIYRASTFESFMQETVNQAAYTDKNGAWVEQQLRRSFADYDVPPDASVHAGVNNGRVEARVQYARTIPLAVTQYGYTFDKTVHSSTAVGGGG